MIYKLMINTHNKTGLKYLCITKREDYLRYKGSGIHRTRHLKKYGSDVTTELLYQSNDYSHFVEVCKRKSIELDVASSPDFANAVPETGYNNLDGGPNLVLFRKHCSSETKKQIEQKRAVTLKNNHWVKGDAKQAICRKISEVSKINWSKLTKTEKLNKLKFLHAGCINFHSHKDTETYIHWKDKCSVNMKRLYLKIFI